MRMTLPPPPCLIICRPAARAISQDWVTLASITSRKSLAAWSTIFDTLLSPPATTRMSTRPKASTAAFTMASQLASESGRLPMLATLAPRAAHSPAIFFSSAALPAASVTLAPAAASTCAASFPNAPDAPVMMALLPRMSNSERGFLNRSSAMIQLISLSWSAARPLAPPRPSGERSARSCAPGEGARAHIESHSPPHPNPLPAGERERAEFAAPLSLHRRDRHHDRADLVAAIDDLAHLIRSDDAGIVLLQHRLLSADDHGQLARQHEIDFLRRRGVGPGAATGQEVRHADDQRLRAAGFRPEQAQRQAVAVVGRLVGLGLAEASDLHQNFSPFSTR